MTRRVAVLLRDDTVMLPAAPHSRVHTVTPVYTSCTHRDARDTSCTFQ
eukprot:gene10902-biopygen9607